MSTTHTNPWLIPIITWCRPFPFVPTNILLIKSKLKLESRAIAVDVAMSPRNLGGKYRCRPHPRPRTCTRQFFAGTRACWLNCTRVASSLDDHDNIVDHVVCLKAEFLWHTVLSNENGEFYTYGIYPYLNRSVCLLMGSATWRRFSFCSSGSSLMLHDDVTHRSCANFKCEVIDVNNWIPIDFGGVKCVSVGSDQPCYDSISWYIQFH